ncbi:MAG: hypothetical protein IPP72_10415 [Chitinophagaceae bacterium]|nr:hypothetical protein [Chitinophagaceae bacterium]
MIFLLAVNAAVAQNYFAGTGAGTSNTGSSVTGAGSQAISSSNSAIDKSHSGNGEKVQS